MNENKTIGTLADVLSLIDQTGLTGTRRPGHDLGHQADLRNGRQHAGVRVCRAARLEGDALSHSSGRPRGQRQELLEPKEPSGCGT
jgi:hypothetical protein